MNSWRNSRRNAQLDIESIQSKHNHNHNPELISVVRNILDILAKELYDSSTRFLLELLQNADDNKYKLDPSFKLTYRPGALRIDNNEVGFTNANVEAICSIGNSTKRGKNHSHGCTGEKGIGFKSVFRVADEVWVSSSKYTFKFDKREELGIISPIWADFPEKTDPRYTSIYLKLSKDCNTEELVEYLRDFDPSVLLFLRTIRHIDLEIISPEGESWTKSLRRIDRDESEDGHSIRELHIGQEKLEYIIRRHRVEEVSNEARQPGYSHSELILAFPVTNSHTMPQPGPRNVHAFLPISDYGFKFYLNGDFLLPANRQRIDTSSLWNNALRDALAEAFVRAVEYFNRSNTVMKYYWPYYVPDSNISPFFQPARTYILRDLKRSTVLESCAHVMAEASQLVYVDRNKYADEKGEPFTLSTLTESRYLSPKYPLWTIESICELGVLKLSDREFLNDLKSMIDDNPTDFRARSPQWHSQLAKALTVLTAQPDLMSTLEDLCIIPLSDGGWTTARNELLFLQGALPPNLYNKFNPGNFHTSPILIFVDQVAARDETRRGLFERLGVGSASASQICQRISESHASPSFEPGRWTPDGLMSHARFLYEAKWSSDRDVDLWFATSNDERCKGSRLYIPGSVSYGSEDSASARVFKKLATKYPIIHDAYMTNTQRDWKVFLIETLKLSTIPRLVTYSVDTKRDSFALSEEFKFLFRECDTSDILHVLNENWHTYSEWIESDITPFQDSGPSSSREALVNAIKATIVKTGDRLSCLSETVFPGLDAYLEEHLPSLPVLDIETPKDRSLRRRLSLFGILVENDVDYYLFCLRRMQVEYSPDLEILSHVYEHIQIRYNGNEDRVDDAFAKENLIYVKPSSLKTGQSVRWANINECVKRKINVESQYPRCESLFRCLLAYGAVEIGTLIDLAIRIDKTHKLPYIVKLFSDISAYLRVLSTDRAVRAVRPLRNKWVFPITKKETQTSYDEFGSAYEKSWFIADRPHLRESFRGKVNLLAFTVEENCAMEHLFQALMLDPRRLSKVVSSKTTPEGPLRYIASKTDSIRRRVPFLNMLIPILEPRRKEITRQMESISVWTAGKITQTYKLKHEDCDYIGHPGKGQAHLSVNGCSLQVFVEEEEITSKQPSFDLVDLIATHCNIRDALHLKLLHAALGNDNIQRIQALFAREGFNVNVMVEDKYENPSPRYFTKAGDLLTIPSPFSYAGSETERSTYSPSTSSGADLVYLGNFRWNEDESRTVLSDRRLKMMEIRYSELAPTTGLIPWTNLDPNNTLQYLGQCLASEFFERYIGSAYTPVTHWTSVLRSRAGLKCTDDFGDRAPFTMTGLRASRAVRRFLVENGYTEASQWDQTSPTYHFDIAPSAGDWHSPFACSTSKLELMRRLKLPEAPNQRPKDVMILIRISSIYTHPCFHFFVNPWSLFVSNLFSLLGHHLFEAVIDPSQPITQNDFSQRDVTTTEKRYKYRGLKDGEIRLFVMFPAERREPLRGMICEYAFADAPPYKSLSYTWGLQDRNMHKIITPKGFLLIKENLNAALLRLRSRTGAVILWIDAICINQAKNDEKAKQIRLLPEIFQHATCTLAFLGADENSDEAIKMLMQVRANDAYGAESEDWPKNLPKAPSAWGGRNMPPPEDPIWQFVVALFNRDWFRRAWIIQEVVAAPTVSIVCGSWMIDWNDLFFAMHLIDHELQPTKHIDSTSWKPFLALAEHREWEARQGRWSLFLLLEAFRHVHSSLKRDRFFSLLGLANDGHLEEFEPDYGCPFKDIVCRFARTFITQGKGIQMLYRAGISSQPDRFPSWIPNWTTTRPGSLSESLGRGVVYDASRSTEPDIELVTGTENVITVRAWNVDEVIHVSKWSNEPKETEKLDKYFEEIDSMIMEFLSPFYEQSQLDKLKWQVPVAGALHPENTIIGDVDIFDSYKAFGKILKKSRYKRAKVKMPSEEDTIRAKSESSVNEEGTLRKRSLHYLSLLRDTIQSWRFVTTKRGRCGIAPENVAVGDLVSVFAGGKVPFLIRKSTKGEYIYYLVGESYIYGIMNGEVVDLEDVEYGILELC